MQSDNVSKLYSWRLKTLSMLNFKIKYSVMLDYTALDETTDESSKTAVRDELYCTCISDIMGNENESSHD